MQHRHNSPSSEEASQSGDIVFSDSSPSSECASSLSPPSLPVAARLNFDDSASPLPHQKENIVKGPLHSSGDHDDAGTGIVDNTEKDEPIAAAAATATAPSSASRLSAVDSSIAATCGPLVAKATAAAAAAAARINGGTSLLLLSAAAGPVVDDGDVGSNNNGRAGTINSVASSDLVAPVTTASATADVGVVGVHAGAASNARNGLVQSVPRSASSGDDDDSDTLHHHRNTIAAAARDETLVVSGAIGFLDDDGSLARYNGSTLNSSGGGGGGGAPPPPPMSAAGNDDDGDQEAIENGDAKHMIETPKESHAPLPPSPFASASLTLHGDSLSQFRPRRGAPLPPPPPTPSPPRDNSNRHATEEPTAHASQVADAAGDMEVPVAALSTAAIPVAVAACDDKGSTYRLQLWSPTVRPLTFEEDAAELERDEDSLLGLVGSHEPASTHGSPAPLSPEAAATDAPETAEDSNANIVVNNEEEEEEDSVAASLRPHSLSPSIDRSVAMAAGAPRGRHRQYNNQHSHEEQQQQQQGSASQQQLCIHRAAPSQMLRSYIESTPSAVLTIDEEAAGVYHESRFTLCEGPRPVVVLVDDGCEDDPLALAAAAANSERGWSSFDRDDSNAATDAAVATAAPASGPGWPLHSTRPMVLMIAGHHNSSSGAANPDPPFRARSSGGWELASDSQRHGEDYRNGNGNGNGNSAAASMPSCAHSASVAVSVDGRGASSRRARPAAAAAAGWGCGDDDTTVSQLGEAAAAGAVAGRAPSADRSRSFIQWSQSMPAMATAATVMSVATAPPSGGGSGGGQRHSRPPPPSTQSTADDEAVDFLDADVCSATDLTARGTVGDIDDADGIGVSGGGVERRSLSRAAAKLRAPPPPPCPSPSASDGANDDDSDTNNSEDPFPVLPADARVPPDSPPSKSPMVGGGGGYASNMFNSGSEENYHYDDDDEGEGKWEGGGDAFNSLPRGHLSSSSSPILTTLCRTGGNDNSGRHHISYDDVGECSSSIDWEPKACGGGGSGDGCCGWAAVETEGEVEEEEDVDVADLGSQLADTRAALGQARREAAAAQGLAAALRAQLDAALRREAADQQRLSALAEALEQSMMAAVKAAVEAAVTPSPMLAPSDPPPPPPSSVAVSAAAEAESAFWQGRHDALAVELATVKIAMVEQLSVLDRLGVYPPYSDALAGAASLIVAVTATATSPQQHLGEKAFKEDAAGVAVSTPLRALVQLTPFQERRRLNANVNAVAVVAGSGSNSSSGKADSSHDTAAAPPSATGAAPTVAQLLKRRRERRASKALAPPSPQPGAALDGDKENR